MTAPTPPAEQVGFGDVKTSTFPQYKGVAKQTDRVAILTSPNGIIRRFVHFHDGKGFACLSTEDKKGICCEHLRKSPEQKFGIVLFVYSADPDGELLAPEKLSGRVKFWIFSEAKIDLLKPIAKEWPIMDGGVGEVQHDLKINCSEEKYQRMDINPQAACHFKKDDKQPKWYDTLHAQVEKAEERIRIKIGSIRTEAEVREILGIGSGNAAQAPASANDVDMGDVLAE